MKSVSYIAAEFSEHSLFSTFSLHVSVFLSLFLHGESKKLHLNTEVHLGSVFAWLN